MQKEYECMIIRDLLPSYMEQLTNETTNELVKEHLKACGKCEEFYEELMADMEAARVRAAGKDKKFRGRLQRYRYELMGGFLGVIFIIVMLAGGLRWSLWNVNQENSRVVHTECVEDYGEWENYEGLSHLALFPAGETLAKHGATVERFVYDCFGPQMYQTCQIYAECRYGKEAFLQEVQRLQSRCWETSGKSVISNQRDYAYPAVYAMRNTEGCNEYALIMEADYKIIYIYLQGSVDRRDLYFTEEYLPPDYGQNGLSFEEVENYNMYEK